MIEEDQVYRFREAVQDTFFCNQTSVDALTNQSFATLDALFDDCTALYESRQNTGTG